MTEPRILVSSEEAPAASAHGQAAATAWRLLGWIGLVLFAVAGTDTALVWMPPDFGSPEWEFGSVISALNGLPATVLGMALLLTAALVTHRAWLAKTMMALFLALALAVLVMGLILATNLPMALGAVTETVARQSLMKVIAKAVVQIVGYPLASLVVVWIGWRQLRSATSGG